MVKIQELAQANPPAPEDIPVPMGAYTLSLLPIVPTRRLR